MAENEFKTLRDISAKIGANPMLIQAAGGNTSIKIDDLMWIKASGTQLKDAQTSDIFVPVMLEEMRKSLEENDAFCDQPVSFIADKNYKLRPSIETSLHAVFQQKIVLHVHCVNTLAHAIRADCVEILSEKLNAYNFAIVPYTKPGANLARAVKAQLTPETNVVILQNHGLIVAGETVDEAHELLMNVHEILALTTHNSTNIKHADLVNLSNGTGYSLPIDDSLHSLAFEDARVDQLNKGSLYPDHVIFCGIGVTLAQTHEEIKCAKAPFIIIPKLGVVVRKDASLGNLALMKCLHDVIIRVPSDANLNYLTLEQNLELLDWDAEKYRQSLNV